MRRQQCSTHEPPTLYSLRRVHARSKRTQGGPARGSKGGARHKAKSHADDEDAEEQAELDQEVIRLESQPACITGGTMRDYQLEGLNWLLSLHQRDLNAILADEMGLGKTLQTIAFLGYLSLEQKAAGDSDAKPHLVVLPLTVLGNWGREIEKFCPSLRVLKLHGSKDERPLQVQRLREREYDVCLTTYETVSSETAALKKVQWGCLVVDEAHRLKNENSRLAVILRQLPSQRRLLLTGTPIQNNLHELWALLNFLFPDIFTSSELFDTSVDAKLGTVDPGLVGQLHWLLQRCLLRRLKADVEKGLPPKTETTIFLPLSAMQVDWYRRVLMRDLSALGAGRGSFTSVQNIVMHLRKVCNHPYLFDGAEPGPPFVEGEHLIQNSGKLVVMDKLLRKLKEGGHRVLVFTTMTKVLDILEDYCLYRGHKHCRLDGSSSTEEREEMMAAFNAPGSDIFIFMLSTRAGGLGINLFTADTVILYDSDWNPQADLQAQDRAHRIGQTRPVSVYRLCVENTLEEKILERAERKLYLDRLVIEQGRLGVAMPNLKPDELMGLIRFGADAVLKMEGATLTEEDIDELLKRGKERTAQKAAKLKADCQHSLANFSMEAGGDPAKLYQLDGIEYDAKGVRELIDKLRAAEQTEGGAAGSGGSGGNGGAAMSERNSLLHQLLTSNWSLLRTIKICHEPGGVQREGETMENVVRRKVEELKGRPQPADAQGSAAYYTVDKREVAERHWSMVADILKQLGLETVDRTLVIPYDVCMHFEARILGPWQAAWRHFRDSRKRGATAEDTRADAGTSGVGANGVVAKDGAVAEQVLVSGGDGNASGEALPTGDTIFTWGCLDWTTPSLSNVGSGKKGSGAGNGSAFVVSVPELLPLPAALQGERLAQVACGSRHSVAVTAHGEAYAWGRGMCGQLGVVAAGATAHPLPLRALWLGGHRVVAVACGQEHTCLLTREGIVFGFGAGKRGQTGLDTTENVTVPARMRWHARLMQRASAISCGANHTAVLLPDGLLLTCGAAEQGVLGHGFGGREHVDEHDLSRVQDAMQLQLVSVFTADKLPLAAISCGGTHNLGLTRSGAVYSFGAGSWGRLGLGSSDIRDKHQPTRVKAADHLGTIRQVAAGLEHSLLLLEEGSVFQFGRSGSSYQSTPSVVVGIGPSHGVRVRSISAGKGYTAAVSDKGEVYVWGAMSPPGAIGLGARDGTVIKNARQPTKLDALEQRCVGQVSAGYTHLVALADSVSSTCTEMAVPPEERFGSTSQEGYADAVCEKCQQPESPRKGELIFCDSCNNGYHLECHDPPLREDALPEGDWHCFNCKLERLSVCAVCGMQDETNATLALCDTNDCLHFGACHIECMPPHMRPPVQLPKLGSEDDDDLDEIDVTMDEVDGVLPGCCGAAAGAADGAAAVGAAGVVAPGAKPGAPGAPPPQWRPGDPKRVWKLDHFRWFCAHCAEEDGEARPPAYGVNKKHDAKKMARKGGSKAGVKEAGPSVAAASGAGEAGAGALGAAAAAGAPLPAALPLPRTELTFAHRRLLKQYHDLCPTPDEAQTMLLAALTDRNSPAEVTAWLHERTVELRRRERAKEEAARKAAEDRAQRLNQAGAAQPLPPSERESLSFEAAAERMRAQRLHQAGAAQPQGVTFKGFEAVAERMERERLLHVGPPPPKPLSFDDAAERWFPTQAQARDRQKITKQFEDLKQRGNQAYQQQQYELANQYYIAATSADPKNVTGSLHTIYSNMSAVFATQGDWRGSYNYAYYAVQLVPSFAKGHSRMATALAALEHFAEARTAYITCLQIEPANNYARAQIAELDKKIAQGLGRPLQGPQPSHAASTAPPVEPEPQTQLQPPSQPLPKPKQPAAPAAPVGESSAPAVAPKAKAQCSGSAWGLVAGLPTAAGAAAQPQAAPKRTASSTDGPSLPKDDGIPKRQHTSPSTLAGAPVAETAAELSPQVLQQMGNTAFRKNDHEEAIRCFDEAILQCSRGNGPAESLLVALYSNRSAVLCAIHRYEEALADADLAVKLNPTWSRGHSRRGNALHAMAKKGTATKDAAREAYERALQLDPENSIVRRALDGLIATMDDNEVEVQVEA